MSKTVHPLPHKYKLIKLKKLVGPNAEGKYTHEVYDVKYKCFLPNCTHFMPQIEMTEGMLSLCWGNCKNFITMTKEMMTLEKPMCSSCREKRKVRRARLTEAARRAS